MITITSAAEIKALQLLSREDNPDLFLRIAVQPGGCSGLRYQLYYDDGTLEGDLSVLAGALSVVVDRQSAPYLDGAIIDYVDTIDKSGFVIDNPNAAGTCSCGDSFN